MDLRRPEEVVEGEEGEGGEDQIGRIPDDLLLHILGRVHDARSLARCLAVSKRFSSLVALAPTVSLSFPPRPRLLRPSSSSGLWRHRSSSSSFLSRLLDKFVGSPLRFLCRVVSPKSASCYGGDGGDDCDCDNGSHPTPGEVLKPFKGIESLRVELPSCVDAVGLNGERTVLRWTARFGGKMESCVVLGANSLRRREDAAADAASGEEGAPESSPRAVGEVELEPAPVIAEEELKLRVVWIISCLIAASARHYLLKQIVADHPMLRSVAIVDSDKQGTVRMREEEIAEMRRSLDSASAADDAAAAAERIRVPDLRMKLWYAPELELPESGYVMRGATMVLIAPASKVGGEQGKAKEGGDLGDAVKSVSFEGGDGEEEAAFGEAVREMRKMKKTYLLEMNSF